ncbi:class I SAM-dependent methyltransferase [Brevundimonas fluminis]|uniref:class I SAM-dependent methyltransferase n=1 Tax=Brevundimonas fluminis TaxID=2487274 RepID=UPI000F6577C4|nr:class I SAM-dependent methyltransferase [Brevundimonas fluminis]
MTGLPPEELWRDRPVPPPDAWPAARVFDRSPLCRQADFETPWFAWWTAGLGERLRYHRKLWEFVFVAQALHERGLLRMGARGLGFGVGHEPLPAYFAARGCRVVATDLDPDEAARIGWTDTAQHAADLAPLQRPDLCPPDVLIDRVAFRAADMNAVPSDLTGFDFCWSACALEHLGSIAAGLDFIEASLNALRPGGVAVHTTEFNLTSDEDTVDHQGTVLFRARDLRALADRLTAAGHRVAPLDLTPGDAPLDRFLDLPPYRAEPHLKLALEGYETTSVGIIVTRAS